MTGWWSHFVISPHGKPPRPKNALACGLVHIRFLHHPGQCYCCSCARTNESSLQPGRHSTRLSFNRQNIVHAKRLLRSPDVDVDSAERAGTLKSLVELGQKVAKAIKPPGLRILENAGWLRQRTGPDIVFSSLKLDQSVAKLNGNLFQWLRYTYKYMIRKGMNSFSELHIYHLLAKQTPDEELATLFRSLRKVVGWNNFAKNMEKTLTNGWMKRELMFKTNPKDVFKYLGLERASNLDTNPRFRQWLVNIDDYRNSVLSYMDEQIVHMIDTTRPKAETVALFQSLRKDPNLKSFAGEMQRTLSSYSRSTTTKTLMNDAWLQGGETPKNVFKILRLDKRFEEGDDLFHHWLLYVDKYRGKRGADSFPDSEIYGLLWSEYTIDVLLAAKFQAAKQIPDVKKQAENMQNYVFQQWLKANRKPQSLLRESWLNIDLTGGSEKEFIYAVMKAYTLRYAKEKSGDAALKKVEMLFRDDRPDEALTVAVKAL